MTKEELTYPSRDNRTAIHAVKWIPESGKPVCVLQVVHGMAEHIGRYEEFAEYMAERGVLVTGEDHLGHGRTVEGVPDGRGIKGYFCSQDPATVVVRDVHRLKKIVQEQYPQIPYYILGHSMGSFIVRNYICRYGTGIDGAVIVGTGSQPAALLALSKIIAKVQALFIGEDKESRFLNLCAFGSYNKRIPGARTEVDWLCRDEQVVDRYKNDPLCGFTFTVNGFRTLFELIARLGKKESLQKVPKDLPLLFLAGEEDPVGNYGKGVEKAFRSLKDAGVKEMSIKLYPEDRHEILNEIDRKAVYETVLSWIVSRINERKDRA